MSFERHKLALKRWLTTVTLPVLPQFAPALPDSVVGRNWPVFGRAYPRSIRWPLNGSRLLVWVTARCLRPLMSVRFLRWFFWLGWNLGAATQALFAVVVALVGYVFLTIPVQLLGGVFRGVVWVVLVRRGWQQPLAPSFDSYMDALDRELDAAVAAQDQADALVASTMESFGSIDWPEVRQVVHVDYPLHTTDPALADTVAGRRGPGLRATVLAAVVVVALAIGVRSVDLPQPPEWSEIHGANHSDEVGP